MFRFPSWISALTVLCFGTFWISYLCHFKEDSLSKTQRLELKKFLADSSFSIAEQTRKQVRKDIWVSQTNHQRLQNRMDSESSLLTLQPKKNSVEIIEDLQNIRCWSQEKIYTTNQAPVYQMRFLTAEKGTYKYETQTFQASEATLALYKIPGLSLITNLNNQKAFLQGTAEEISFTVQSGVPSFQAHQFKASLSPGDRK